MKVLLDTNVLSEVRRPAPEPKVLAWLDTIDEDRAFISVASIAELRLGIALMADGRRRAALDPAIAEHWGDVMAQARQSGFALSVMDGFFAATALAHALVLATRNTKDFAPLGLPLFNPWTDESEPR
jgi:predicted nucleic acid-binding protein